MPHGRAISRTSSMTLHREVTFSKIVDYLYLTAVCHDYQSQTVWYSLVCPDTASDPINLMHDNICRKKMKNTNKQTKIQLLNHTFTKHNLLNSNENTAKSSQCSWFKHFLFKISIQRTFNTFFVYFNFITLVELHQLVWKQFKVTLF